MRIVLDTNVLVSALVSPDGLPARLLRLCEAQLLGIVVSDAILDEYRRALGYEKVAARRGRSPADIARLVDEFRSFSDVVAPEQVPSVVADDPADDKFLACAVEGSADYIVSGDRHLLQLGEYRGIPILSPRTFLAVLPGPPEG